ncbi:MAG: NADH-quinone oxidoreductase subunit J [Acidobacteriaceae bacterium]|nr:NADH-quinone oxidoreductase subunit J [Acidobacteriaceae bacterium]
MIDATLFYIFAALTLGGALMTITRRNAVLSAVWLTVSLMGVAGLFLLLGAEFLFVAQIIVYIGGITLLFLFVVMLINLEAAAHVSQFRRGWPLLVLAGAGFAAELIIAVRRIPPAVASNSNSTVSVAALSDVLLSRYALPFEVASVLLLVAIVGSVWMGLQRSRLEGRTPR